MRGTLKYILMLLLLLVPMAAIAEPPPWEVPPPRERAFRHRGEHGGMRKHKANLCYSGERGEKYGACRPVFNRENAVRRIREFHCGDVEIANMVERPWYFIADILDKEGHLLDKVIIHKRSGRIRSVF